MGKNTGDHVEHELPTSARDYISRVTAKMRYRKRVRRDVEAELAAHFEDGLRECTTAEGRDHRAQELVEQFGDAKLLAVLCRRAKKRCRPLWRKVVVRSLQGLGVVVLYLLLCASPLLVGRPTIRVDYVERLNKLVRAERDEAVNARPHYVKAAELCVKMPDWLAVHEAKSPADLNDVEAKLLSDWLEGNTEAIEALREGSRCRGYWREYHSDSAELVPGLVAEAMEILPGYRYLAFAMRWQIRRDAYEGNAETAASDCIVLARFGCHLDGQGLLIEQMVGIAIEALAYGELTRVLDGLDVPGDVLESVQRELQELFRRSQQVVRLDAEKVFWYDQIQRTFTDDGQGGGRPLARALPYIVGEDWTDSLWRLVSFNFPNRREARATVDAYFARVHELLAQTPWDLHSKGFDADAWAETLPAALMLRIQWPAHYRVNQLKWRLKTHRAAVLTILALMRHKAETSHYPADLRQLVDAGYIGQLPNDPFGTGPLSYDRTADGFLLYSWGEDLRDDAGRMGEGRTGKPRMWADNGDWVFWPVEQDQE